MEIDLVCGKVLKYVKVGNRHRLKSLVITKFLWLVIGLFFFNLNGALSVLVVIVSVLLLNGRTIYWRATMLYTCI